MIRHFYRFESMQFFITISFYESRIFIFHKKEMKLRIENIIYIFACTNKLNKISCRYIAKTPEELQLTDCWK